jgi:diguanylate cyclase (GGDEF)-like protein
MSAPPRDRLREEITSAEALLATLDSDRESVRARLQTLRDQLAESRTQLTPPSEASPILHTRAPATPAEKVRLFRQLFRGREDVFPRLWLNSKTGKKGYAPACSNEWVRGICEKPRIRCGECPNQAFIPVGDQIILDHLRARHVIGIYPLLKDETCWLLAVDFDKGSWTDDVLAFAETCRRLQIPGAVERSRSGNGAHVWFFYRASRKKTKVGFLLVDLDRFKGFNDKFGHIAGDATLRELSTFVQKRSRADDILCRYGGEEFLLVLWDCSLNDLVRRAEELRDGAKQLHLEHEGRALGRITLSVGVALFPDHGKTPEDLFQAADAALYLAKKEGRDRVMVASSIPMIIDPDRGPENRKEH